MPLTNWEYITSPYRFQDLVRHKNPDYIEYDEPHVEDEPEYNEGLGPEFRKWVKKSYKVTDEDIRYSSCGVEVTAGQTHVRDLFTDGDMGRCDNNLYRDKKPVANLGDLLHGYFGKKKGCYDIELDERADYAGYGDANWIVKKLEDCEAEWQPVEGEDVYGDHA